MTGFWHIQDHPEAISVKSPDINPNLVTLPDSGQLPTAFGGTHVAWFGEASTGSFCGSDFNTIAQSPKDGCTSTKVQSGDLTSPVFSLAGASTAQMSFAAWWEIESVNADTFDIMDVEYTTDGGATWNSVGKLNPANNPAGNHDQSYSNEGLEKSPMWHQYTADLSAAAGQPNVQVRFRFDTVDDLYNGFRGLLVDNVGVSTPFAQPSPIISSLSPSCVPSAGTTTVDVLGTNFILGSQLSVDGNSVPTFVLADTRAEFNAVDLAAGNHSVKIVSPNGASSNAISLNSAAGICGTPPPPPPPDCTEPSNLLGNPGFESPVAASSGFPAPLTLGNWLPFNNGNGVPTVTTSLPHCGTSSGLVTGGYWVQDLPTATDPTRPLTLFDSTKPFEFSFWFHPQSAGSLVQLVSGWDRGIGNVKDNLISLSLTGAAPPGCAGVPAGSTGFQALAVISGIAVPGTPCVPAHTWIHFVAVTSGLGGDVSLSIGGIPFGPAKFGHRPPHGRASVLMGDTRGGSSGVAYDDVYLSPAPTPSSSGPSTLTLLNKMQVQPCGQNGCALAKVTARLVGADGSPIANQPITLSVTPQGSPKGQPPPLQAPSPQNTDSNGLASFSFTASSPEAAFVHATAPDPATGKTLTSNTASVFFTPPPTSLSPIGFLAPGCTGTVLQSSSGSVVATAGHCLNLDCPGGSVCRGDPHIWTFAPFYDFARSYAPYGVWDVTEIHMDTTNFPTANSDHRYDFAFFRISADDNGRTGLQTAGGFLPTNFSATTGSGFNQYAYPGVPKSSGTPPNYPGPGLLTCTPKNGSTAYDESPDANGAAMYNLSCNNADSFVGSSSGGPLIDSSNQIAGVLQGPAKGLFFTGVVGAFFSQAAFPFFSAANHG